LFYFFSCSSNSNVTSPAAQNTGSASVTIAVGKVGALAKMRTVADIQLAKLCVSFTAPGAASVYDTIALSGNGASTVVKTYPGLASTVLWTLTANTIDVKDSIIHWDRRLLMFHRMRPQTSR